MDMMMDKDKHNRPPSGDHTENHPIAETAGSPKEETVDDLRAKEEKEARKMRLRKILYPIAILVIALLWLSSLLEQ